MDFKVVFIFSILSLVQGELSWTSWSRWGQCSVSCGKGARYRKRECMYKRPGSKSNSSFIARGCAGPAEMYSPCQMLLCPAENECSCGCELKGPNGMISTSLGYSVSKICQWDVNVRSNKGIALKIQWIEIKTGYLRIAQGGKTVKSIVQPGVQPDLPLDILIPDNDVTVQFVFHGDPSFKGKAKLNLQFKEFDLPLSNGQPETNEPVGDKSNRIVGLNVPAIAGITACVILIVVIVTVVTVRRITRDSNEDATEIPSQATFNGNPSFRRNCPTKRADSFMTSMSTQSSSQGQNSYYSRVNV